MRRNALLSLTNELRACWLLCALFDASLPSKVPLNIPLPTSIFLPRPDLAMGLLGLPPSPEGLLVYLASQSNTKPPVDKKKKLRKTGPIKEKTALLANNGRYTDRFWP